MSELDAKLKRFLDGYSNGDEMQEPPGQDGDPQLAALSQFLQTYSTSTTSHDIVLDIGSGRGIVGHKLLEVWPTAEKRPWYFAVDLEQPLDELHLPAALHNHSRKISFADFIRGALSPELAKVKLAVCRNVLHHFDIPTTASVLLVLRQIAQAGNHIYLQDIVSLPKGEYHNVGWIVENLKSLLEAFGFEFGQPITHRSRSKTQWFTIILQDAKGKPMPSEFDARRLVGEERERQRAALTTKLVALRGASGGEQLHEYITLATEIAAITAQLQERLFSNGDGGGSRKSLSGVQLVPLPPSEVDYAEEIPADSTSKSGLRGILSSKHLVDLPALLDSATKRLWFAGYSERLLFRNGDVRDALKRAVLKGIDFRLLLVDPASAAAEARSATPSYASRRAFLSDVLQTVGGYAEFETEVKAAARNASSLQIDLRLCEDALSSSYFLVDDKCIFSLYGPDLTGGAGPAFVFEQLPEHASNYFQVLSLEFQHLWERAKLRRK